MIENETKKPPRISTKLCRAFLQKQNTLLIHSKGIEVLHSLAQSLHSEPCHLTLLIDFSQTEIQEINYHLQELSCIGIMEEKLEEKLEVISIVKFVKEKRKRMYTNGGIFAITTQIFFMDCLSEGEELKMQLVSKVFIKEFDSHISDRYSLLSWLCTLINLYNSKIVVTLITSLASYYKGDNLSKIMRLTFMKNLALWPFGRSEIHQALTNSSLKNINHKLTLNATEVQLQQFFGSLMKYASKNIYDLTEVEGITFSLFSCSKLVYLERLWKCFDSSGDNSIWKSNNLSVIEAVDGVMNQSKGCIWRLLSCSERLIDLNSLLETETEASTKNDMNCNEKEEKEVFYTLNYNLHVPGLDETPIDNHPLFPLKFIEILRDIKNDMELRGFIGKEEMNEKRENESREEENFDRIEEQKKIEYLTSLRKEGIKNFDSESRSKPEILEIEREEELLKSFSQKNEEYSGRDHRIENDDKEIARNEESSKFGEKEGGFDLSIYEFNTSMISNSISQPLIHPRPSSNLLDEVVQNEEEIQPQFDHLSDPEQRLFSPHKHQTDVQVDCSSNPKTLFSPHLHIHSIPSSGIIEEMLILTPSQSISKQLHYYTYCFETKTHYIAYIKQLYFYLHLNREQRINEIKRLVKKLIKSPGGGMGNRKSAFVENEPVLLEELYLELKRVKELIDVVLQADANQSYFLFEKEIERSCFRYVDKTKLFLHKNTYNPCSDSVLSYKISEHETLQVRLCFLHCKEIAELTQSLRLLMPSRIFMYYPNTIIIRHLNILNAENCLVGVEKIDTVYFDKSLESERAAKTVKEEDEAFWNIAQEKIKLAQYNENPELRIDELIIEDEILKKMKMMALASQNQLKSMQSVGEINMLNQKTLCKVERTILIDKREFKSLLPSYLFHCGFKIIPVFLENADYILSNDLAIEKKSVHTRDLHESLKSGRLFDQIKRMCAKFTKPYLLIECPDISHFRKEEFSYSSNKITGERYTINIRKKLIEILCRFPKLNVIWSTNYLQTIELIKELKKNAEDPDIMKFRPQSEEENEVIEESVNNGLNEEEKESVFM